jgi:pyruvate/2-oxoglutarate dehydrogenase complex dihydrolipoamide dehydrogenase (E3) component
MEPREVDVVVIGLGPGGEALATQLAKAGLDVVGVDRRLVGGECPYFGCIPTKMIVRAAEVLAEGRRVPDLAGSSEVRADWAPVATRIRTEATDDWNDSAAVERFEAAGGHFLRGQGRISAPGEVTVATKTGEQVLVVRKGIVLNPGTEPAVPPIEGLADTPYWTNRDAVRAEQAPGSLIVLGGGPIGLEFAQAFARFDTNVTVLEAGPAILGPSEPEAAKLLTDVLTREGLTVRTGVHASSVTHDGDHFTVTIDDGEGVTGDRLLVSAGRYTDLPGLGIANVGLDDTARSIPTDNRMRAADGVWVIGDVAGHGAFTHLSMYHSRIAATDILGTGDETAAYHAVPSVTFTDPEVGQVGLTEQGARQKGIQVRTGMTDVPSTTRGWIHKSGNDGLIKVVEDVDRRVLVGATVVAPAGGEILGALTVAVHAQVPTTLLRQMIYVYPTIHRGIETALADLDNED